MNSFTSLRKRLVFKVNRFTRGEAETEIAQAIVKFEREYMGRGPEDSRVYLFDDIVFIRLRGVLTPAERQLTKTDDSTAGRKLIKEVRQELLEKARMLIETIIYDVLGFKIKSMHTDISTTTGERIIVFTLEGKPLFRDICPEKRGV
jgi:uncharacterized protein YbcI